MMRSLRKTFDRTSRFFRDALAWRPPERQYFFVAWGLIVGAVWFTISLAGDPGWALPAIAGCYLVVLLASVCAIDGPAARQNSKATGHSPFMFTLHWFLMRGHSAG